MPSHGDAVGLGYGAGAAWNVAQEQWTFDLHADAEELVSPLREPRFYWPSLEA